MNDERYTIMRFDKNFFFFAKVEILVKVTHILEFFLRYQKCFGSPPLDIIFDPPLLKCYISDI